MPEPWNETDEYLLGATVVHGGHIYSWSASGESRAVEPPDGSWVQIDVAPWAAGGFVGATGPAGAVGPKGDTGDISAAGVTGATGATGTPGTPGSGGPGTTGGNRRIDQAIPATEWLIPHGLGFYPNITTVDSLGRVVEGDIEHIDTNNAVARFAFAFSGSSLCS